MKPHITIPDDFPKVFSGTKAEDKTRTLGEVHIHPDKAETQEELIQRIKGSEVVINIRAYTHLTREVLACCPDLRFISVWGTGTDHAAHSVPISSRGVRHIFRL